MLNDVQVKMIECLAERCKETGIISKSELIIITNGENEDYYEAADYLRNEGYLIQDFSDSLNIDFDEELCEEDLHNYDFGIFSKEVENDLLNKDIDDIVQTICNNRYGDDPVKLYLSEIGLVDLLNPNEEIVLARTIQEGILAYDKLSAYESGNIELNDQEISDLRKVVEDGYVARNKMIEANFRLVVSIAKRYLGRGLPLQDLIEEGNMGLLKAVKKFDPNKGFKFSTYATWWIKQSVTRAIADQSRTIRVPVHMVETINRMIRAQRKLCLRLQRDPTLDELASELGMSVEKVLYIQKTAQDPVSFDSPVGEDEDSTLGDFIFDSNMPNPIEYTINTKFKEEIEAVLKTLTPREEKVLRLRYGLDDGRARTLEEVGKEFGVTRERIRQIESKAIKRLRHPSRQKRLSQYK